MRLVGGVVKILRKGLQLVFQLWRYRRAMSPSFSGSWMGCDRNLREPAPAFTVVCIPVHFRWNIENIDVWRLVLLTHNSTDITMQLCFSMW